MAEKRTGKPQETIVRSIPRPLLKYWKPLLIATAIFLVTSVVAQVLVALYYLIVLHQNVV
jgi:hypothetical protein